MPTCIDTALPVLIVDDHPDVRLALRMLLQAEGIPGVDVGSPAAAIEAAARVEFACAVVDLNYTSDTTSGGEGIDLIARLRDDAPDLPIVAMTAWGSVDLAVRAMRLGIADFVEKPWTNERMVHTVRGQIALRALRDENRRLRAEAALGREPGQMLCQCDSSAMRRVNELAQRVAAADANVLVLGENGTGKSLMARDIHAMSRRADGPLIRVDMATLPESRFLEAMFGEDGSPNRPGRFELAHGGSLVMEEVGTIGPLQQTKLLRILEEGELERSGSSRTRRVDVRVISTTNADLDEAIRTNRFRRDLLYRLNAMQIRLPSLRERVEDIVPLARHFLLRECQRLGRQELFFAPSAERTLRAYDWPGNVRELEHAIERAVLLAGRDEIEASDLGLGRLADAPLVLNRLTLSEAEDMLVRHAMDRNGQHLQPAADDLGISRQSLYRRLEKQRARGGTETPA
ncbi:MAG: sigma-54 dependent transcriptional regulator [Luteibacter sp.]